MAGSGDVRIASRSFTLEFGIGRDKLALLVATTTRPGNKSCASVNVTTTCPCTALTDFSTGAPVDVKP